MERALFSNIYCLTCSLALKGKKERKKLGNRKWDVSQFLQF